MGIKGLTKLLAEHAPRAAVQRRVEDYRGRVIAVDASLSIYQFLTVVGRKGSELLINESGEVTSHLQGMLYLTVRMLEAGIKPVFVFDGEPPEMKKKELAKRSLKRDDATKDLNRAIEIGDEGSVEKFSKRTVKVTKRHSDDCKRLLRLMGAPVVEAPGGAKAQCASLCENHQVYAVASEDMDSLTFGARRFLCHLTDLGYKKSLVTEFEVSKVLEALELTMNQFIDLCILSGCDYCENIKGIAGQRALKLIRQHGCIEEVLQNLKQTRFSVPEDWPYQEVRTLFKEPHVCTGIPDFMWTAPDLEGLMNFLSTENNFSPDRVEKAVEKIKAARDRYSPGRLPLTPVAGMPGSHTEKGLPIVAHSVTPGLAAVSVGIPPAATREKLWDESSETLFCTCYVDFLHQWKDFKMMSVEEKFSKIAEAMNAKSEKIFAHWQLYSKFKKLKQRYEAHVHPPKKGTTQYWKKKERGDAMFRKMKTGEPPPNLDLLKVIVEAEEDKQGLSKCQNECVPMKKYVDECTERRRLNDELIELKQQLSKCQNECVPMKKYVDECTERRRLNDELIELKGNIRVFCRCRPLSAEEIDHGCSSVVSIDQTDVLILLSEKEKKTFRFDSVFGPDASQESVFAETRPLIRSAMDGSNVCIFAYGQTGTGKTFTMEGPPERRGVNYKSLEELFKISEERRMCIQYTFSVSVLEIYNEQIYDLLADRSKLEIKLSADGTPDVPGLNDSQIYDIDDVWEKLKAGNKNRSVGSTDANKLSSRSHSFVRVTVCSEHLVTGQQSKSYIWLVDLAGSQRNEKTGAGGERLKESQYINKSLSALGDVMSALASESSHIPYRNSKLTHLLQNGLGEDAKSLMFVHISPSSSDSPESVSSLAFANRVRAVQCKSGDHLKLKKMTVKVKQLQKENEELKRMLQDKDKDKRTIRDFVISPTSRPPLIRTRQRQPPQGSNRNCFTPTPSRSRVGKATIQNTIQNKENISMMGTKAKQAQMHVAEMEALRAGMPPVFVNHNNDAGPAVRDIHMENFSVTVGGRDLIQEATITLAFGRHYGLVGRNGTGKTSFLRAMAMHAIDGIPKNCQILHVEQEVVGDDTTALQCVLNADVERVQLLQEEARLVQQQKDLEIEAEFEQGSVKRLEFIDADAAEARAASILAGLSFTPEMQCKRTKQFSGGWRMRIALARALFIEPDLLLLDEPTNHLDLHAVLWLETYLLKWPKTFIVVSHAREFLNTVVTDILHLHGRKLHAYKGDYDTFERTREEHLKNQHKAFETNEKARSHMQAFIDKFRYNAKRASLVQLRIKALERMEHVDAVVSDPDYKFEFPTTDDRPGPPIISFRDASFGYPGGPILFKNLNFGIDLDSRISMVGPNGIGKSTILKLISGDLQPTSGTVFRSPKVRMAVFNQHHVDGLDLTVNPLLYMMRCYPGVPEQKLRSHLGSFGVSGNLALQPMYTLSGGQKSRVAFAQITFKKPHIILLDEPSNHLDLDAVEALIQGLLVFQGGVLMVSHDEHLITGSVDHLWVVSEGRVTPFSGTFKDYKKMLKP